MIVKTVKEMQEHLNNFEDDTPIVIRVSRDEYYEDREVRVERLYLMGRLVLWREM